MFHILREVNAMRKNIQITHVYLTSFHKHSTCIINIFIMKSTQRPDTLFTPALKGTGVSIYTKAFKFSYHGYAHKVVLCQQRMSCKVFFCNNFTLILLLNQGPPLSFLFTIFSTCVVVSQCCAMKMYHSSSFILCIWWYHPISLLIIYSSHVQFISCKHTKMMLRAMWPCIIVVGYNRLKQIAHCK